MRILLKCPSRSRPEKLLSTLRTYVTLANDRSQIGVAVSCDSDDTTMTPQVIQDKLHALLGPLAWHRIFYSANTSKIEACNANMSEIDWAWDIVVLVSDDMIPRIQGWDAVIRTHMAAFFPTTDGILWCNDGYQGDKLNTLCIYGRTMYDSLGCLYRPEYKSFYCDTELTDRCRGDLAAKCRYVPYCIIRHEHPGTGFAQAMDALYAKNQTYWTADLRTYIRRKAYPVAWSVLIPTMPGREASLQRVLASVHEKSKRLAPDMTYEICLSFDNRESSIGVKRQALLQGAKGKYVSFIDDDDEITDAYIEDLWAMIQGSFDTMRLWGQITHYRFVHSTEISIAGPMATMDDPPVFQRPPNHLNPMLADVAKLIPFKDAVRGEDLEWTLALYRTKFLEAEYRSDSSRTHYIYTQGELGILPGIARFQQTTTYETMLGMVFIPAGGAPPPLPPPPTPGPRVLRLSAKGFVSK